MFKSDFEEGSTSWYYWGWHKLHARRNWLSQHWISPVYEEPWALTLPKLRLGHVIPKSSDSQLVSQKPWSFLQSRPGPQNGNPCSLHPGLSQTPWAVSEERMCQQKSWLWAIMGSSSPSNPQICPSQHQRITNTRKWAQIKTGKVLIGYKNVLAQIGKVY